ncbi:hypothetical protein PVAND_015877 [Polypedilum vanderplanki]|uniref:EGF-like domain-containing protein n=1 Tax=Polypedilum vanderplanki TaxID=319348 RepID=A0A9J6BE81_POLVA|nr:hypothetical protein PVAND_015877 [Polypedilum vanderplanki]
MKILTLLPLIFVIHFSLAKHSYQLTKIIDDCISHGDHHFLKFDDCSAPPQHLLSKMDEKFQTLCKNSFKIACLNTKFHSHCENGVKFAKQNGDCDLSSSDVSFKKCCTACKFGQNLKSSSGHCSNSLKRFDTHTASIIDDCCNSFVDILVNDDNHADKDASICAQYDLCGDNEDCIDLPKSDFECRCKNGFRRNEISNACVDINECEEIVNICDEFGICLNKMGSYECKKCPNGFKPGKFTSAEDFECIDIDECAENPCESDKICQNLKGGFECISIDVLSTNCTAGFEMIDDKCFDVNECKIGICEKDEHCTNLKGSFRCEKIQCDPGYINYPKTNCLREPCTKLGINCHKHPIRVSHFFTVVDRFTKDTNRKLFKIESQGLKNYKSFKPVGFNREYFVLKITKGFEAIVSMKKAPMEDQKFEIHMNVYNNRNTLEGHQIYIYHVYVQ